MKAYIIVFITGVLLSFNISAQTLSTNNCELGYNTPRIAPFASTDDGTDSQGIGSFGGPGVTWSYATGPLANPSPTPHSGTRVLQANTNSAANNTSRRICTGRLDFTRTCTNAQMTFGFWMYRFGTDVNADRVNVWINTVAGFGGATLLNTFNRSRALSPIVYGADGWYYYEVIIPTTFGANTYIILDVIDGSPGASGNIYLDDLNFYDNGFVPGSVNGGVANAGPDVSICTGGITQIGAIATPNTTYTWAPAGGLSNINVSNPMASPAGTTNYTVTSTTTGPGCVLSKTDIVVVNVVASPVPVITSASSTSICSGNALSFPFVASNTPLGYLWLANDNVVTSGESNIFTVNTGTLSDIITSPSTQVVTYSVSAYNSFCPAGTSPIQIFSVTVGSIPTITLSGLPPLCNGGNGTVSAAGTNISTYLWNTAATTSSVTGLAAPYSCTVASIPSCSTTSSYVLTQPTALSLASAGAATICSGATANITLTGSGGTPGYTYSWIATSNANVTGESLTTQTSNVINNTLVNTTAVAQNVIYTCTMADANSCLITISKTITVNAAPTVTISGTPILCFGGSSALTASGTGISTYSWNSGSTLSFITTPGGVYGCTVTSVSGCTASASYVLGQPGILNLSAISGTLCSGSTASTFLNAFGGTPAYSFSWIATANANITGESTTTQTGNIINNTLVNTSGSSQVVAYTGTVRDANGCLASSAVNITVPSSVTAFYSGPTSVCSGSTTGVNLMASGGSAPYSFQWIAVSNASVTGESLTTQTITTIINTLINTSSSLQNVLYNFTVTDANSCSKTATCNITVSSSVIATTGPSNITICSTDVGTFTTIATGGSGSFSYQWEVDDGFGFINTNNGPLYNGVNTSTLTVTAPPASMNGYRYRCNISDGCISIYSGVGRLFVNPAILFITSQAEQPILDSVSRCSAKQEILRFNITMSAGACPSTPTVTNIAFTAAGTESEVKRAHIYYTGSNPNFVNTNLFATVPNVVAGVINVGGSQILTGGTNYFWLVYDINAQGSGSDVDATYTNITIAGGGNPGTFPPSIISPLGSRSISKCISPGGISSGLTYWLKSNDVGNIVGNVHDAPVSLWSTSYSSSSDITQSVATKKPLYKYYSNDTLFNFNPYLYFDGNDDILQNTSITDLLKDDGLALIVCARDASPNNRTSFGFQASDGGLAYQIKPEDELLYRNTANKEVSFPVSSFTDPDTDFKMAKMLSIVGNLSGTPDFADFMRNDNVFQSTGNNPADLETGFTIGGSGDGAAYNRGNSRIAEVITYNKPLTSTEIDKIETYVAVKYGIHLNKNYLSSNGTKVWDYAADPTYNNDIAGIGRDNISGLNQKQTQSVNLDEMLTIGLDSIEDKNTTNTATFLENNSYLMWGNNNKPAYSTYTTVIPSASLTLPAGIQGRIQKVWKLQGTNFGAAGNNFKTGSDSSGHKIAASQSLEIAFDDYLLTSVTPTSNLRLLIDNDGVDFSNAVVKGPGKSVGGATAAGSRVSFTVTGGDIGPGKNYITLATTDKAATPLPIELINFAVNCDNKVATITWNTATENNVKQYTIEQSLDGVNFKAIKIISSKGGSSTGANYSVTQDITPSKIIYFRLVEMDYDDALYYFKTVSVSGDCNSSNDKNEIFISPNPLSASVGEVVVLFKNEIYGKTDIKISNSIGTIVYEHDYKLNENYNALKLSLRDLKPGVYILETKNNKGTNRVKFIVAE